MATQFYCFYNNRILAGSATPQLRNSFAYMEVFSDSFFTASVLPQCRTLVLL